MRQKRGKKDKKATKNTKQAGNKTPTKNNEKKNS